MTGPLTLYYAPDNASLCVRLALLEMGIPFDTVLVDRSKAGQHDPAYLALNPNGLIPTLVTPHGPIYETAAILLWLSEQHGDALMPSSCEWGRIFSSMLASSIFAAAKSLSAALTSLSFAFSSG